MDPQTVAVRLEGCALGPSEFSHTAHVQAAWWYLSQNALVHGSQRFVGAIKGFIDHVGAHGKYNDTLTRALLQIIHSRLEPGESWSQFEAGNTDLMAEPLALLARYYSNARLHSARARTSFEPPDLAALPHTKELAL